MQAGTPRGTVLRFRWTALAVIVALGAGSLALPAVRVSGGPDTLGWELALGGWRALGAGIPAWLANPLFCCAVLAGLARRYRTGGTLSGIGVVLGLSSLSARDVALASGIVVPETTFQIGFFLWLCALLALSAWSWSCVALDRDAPRHRCGGRFQD